MIRMIAVALFGMAVVTVDAYAGGPTQGTYAGQTTRGEIVGTNRDQKTELYGPGGYGQAVSAQAHEDDGQPGRGDAVTGQLERDSVVGGGK